MTVAAEITICATTSAYRNHTSILDDALAELNTVQGLQQMFHGPQTEDHSVGYLITLWDSVDDISRFAESANYARMIEALKPGFVLPDLTAKLRVLLATDPMVALTSPITELSILTLAPPASADTRAHSLTMLEDMHRTGLQNGFTASFGELIKYEDKIVLLRGWDSVNVHWATTGQPHTDPVISDLDVKHVQLTMFTN